MIDIHHLSKEYVTVTKEEGLMGSLRSLFRNTRASVTAITELNLQVNQGECLGIVGANGAGKTTLVKLMCGIIAPTTGEINVMGYLPFELKNEFKKKIAFVSGQRNQLFLDLTAYDSFVLLREIYGVSKNSFISTISELSSILEVSDLLNRPIRNLSLGERMKMEIIGALSHNPRILFLDEPTIGLDCISQSKLRKYLKQINENQHTTIILTSHDFSDIIDVCQRCIILSSGRKLFDENIEKLLRRYSTKKIITLYCEREARPPCLPEFCCTIDDTEDKLSFSLPLDHVGYIYGQIVSSNPNIDILVEDEDIASVIERIYGDNTGIK